MFARRWHSILFALVFLAILPLEAAASGPTIIKGTLQIQWGDSERGTGLEVYELAGEDGHIYKLNLTDEQKATVGSEGGIQLTLEAVISSQEIISVKKIETRPPISVQGGELQSRPCRYVNVLCAGQGTTVFPHEPDWYTNIVTAASNYWEKTAGISFESTTTQWVFASQPISNYLRLDTKGNWIPIFFELKNTCAQAAASQIGNPSRLDGINFFFAQSIGCCAWGGGEELTINGVKKFFRTTLMPHWTWLFAGLAHELGHNLGLPHSAGPDGKVYTNKFDLMSDLWGECYLAIDAQWGCMPQGTLFPQLMKLNAIENSRYALISTDKKEVKTYFLGALYRPESDLPPEYVYGLMIDEKKYGGKFGVTAEYRDNAYDPNHRLPVSKGVVLHERNEFGRPEPDHLIANGSKMTWEVGTKFTFSFTTVCVEKEIEFGIQVSVGVNGADCENPPPPVVGKADGFITYNLVIVPTHDIDLAQLPPSINVAIYRKEGNSEKLLTVVVLPKSTNDPSQYVGYWHSCDKPGVYFVRGGVDSVNITQYFMHIDCSKISLPIQLR